MLATLFFCMAPAWAQARNDDLVAGSHEWEVWTGLGHSVSTSVTHTAVWNGGVRYGWVLTDLHGPGFLRGRFEYGVDAVPVFVVFQPARTAYGVSFDPFALRWNFQQRHQIMPYVEFSGGVLFTNHQTPPGESAINFTPSAEHRHQRALRPVPLERRTALSACLGRFPDLLQSRNQPASSARRNRSL